MSINATAMGRLRSWHALAILLLLWMIGGAAEASNRAAIVLVADPEGTRVNHLLQAELAQLGLEVIVVDRGKRDLRPSELTKTARQYRAFAAFRVLVAEGKVEVWLADRATGKVLLREVLETQQQPSETAERTVVARAVELLRASLLELDLDGRPASDLSAPLALPKTIAPTGPARIQPPAADQPRTSVNASLVLLGASLDRTPSPGLSVALSLGLGHHLWLKGRVTAPFAGTEFASIEGRTQLTPYLATLSFGWISDLYLGHIRTGIESGIGLLWTRAVGVGALNYSGRVSNELEPVPMLGGSISYAAMTNLALELGLLGGVGLYPTRLVVSEGESNERLIGHYGQWLGLACAGLNVSWN